MGVVKVWGESGVGEGMFPWFFFFFALWDGVMGFLVLCLFVWCIFFEDRFSNAPVYDSM